MRRAEPIAQNASVILSEAKNPNAFSSINVASRFRAKNYQAHRHICIVGILRYAQNDGRLLH
ncbi:hypothetical protein [Terriglobus sp. RCC_193]|uniref:hypothetical protein n=1 Tax=Terriglobus sp. RCC_193 TaxID=3239218 RepID=UPI003524FE91